MEESDIRHFMKTPRKSQQEKEQALINQRIEEMLSVLEQRNKLIAEYYRSFVLQDDQVLETGFKEQDEPVSP